MRGRWRYKPSASMKHFGFKFLTFGPGVVVNGEHFPSLEDKARAIGLNDEWDRARCGAQIESRPKWPVGSVGECYERAMKLREAERLKRGIKQSKEQESRDDWPRAWKWIGPIFGDTLPRTIRPEDFLDIDAKGEASGLIPKIEQRVSISERHRVIKIWRALWGRMSAMGHCDADKDPSRAVANSAPQPRQAVWSEGEVVRLCKRAWRMNYKGLAAFMAATWDSMLSPIDVRQLETGARKDDIQGALFPLERAKTERAAIGTLGIRATWVLDAYISGLGFELLPDAPIFRTRGSGTTTKGGKPQIPVPYTKNTLGADFRKVREAEFGAAEKRTLADMRRSGTVEATAGGADAHAVSTKMANSLAASARLQKTYNPVNLVTVRLVDALRREGRAKLREQSPSKSVTGPARKV